MTNKSTRLTIEPSDALTKVEVLDAAFQPIHSGVGRMEIDVPLGAYNVQFSKGAAVEQKLVVAVEEGAEVEVRPDGPVQFTSAAPVALTTTIRGHDEPAAWLSTIAPETVEGHEGKGHLVLFARELNLARDDSPLADASLRDADGDLVLDVSGDAYRFRQENWAGAHLALSPGAYRLRQRDREIALYVHEDWQTQVFVTLEPDPSSPDRRQLYLARTSVHLVRPGEGFDPTSSVAVETESAFRALESSAPAPASFCLRLLAQKQVSPALGLYGALLSLRDPETEPELLREVRGRLVGLLGPWPDVVAFAAGIHTRTRSAEDAAALRELGPVAHPPMLAESWAEILRASVAHRSLVPASSVAAQLTAAALGSYPFLVWRPSALRAPVGPPASAPRRRKSPTREGVGVLNVGRQRRAKSSRSVPARRSSPATFANAARALEAARANVPETIRREEDAAPPDLTTRLAIWLRTDPRGADALARALESPRRNESQATLQRVAGSLGAPWSQVAAALLHLAADTF